MIELSVEPARILAAGARPLVVRARNTGRGSCFEIRVELRRTGGLAVIRGSRSFAVERLAEGDAHDHGLEIRCDTPGRHVLRVHRLEFVGSDGRLRRTGGELVVGVDPAPPTRDPRPMEAARGSIFLSYRRADAEAAVRRLASALDAVLPGGVFHDHTSLHGGDLFEPRILREVRAATVLVAVIGPTWLTTENSAGRRRLEIGTDLVRREIVTALEHGVDVVPVLLDGAEAPRPEQLPEPLRPLCDRHFVEIGSGSESLGRLVALLDGMLGR